MKNDKTPRPQPTTFGGIEMRSKTEARWAYFLSKLPLDYIYEPEVYEVAPGQFYLPDFYLPQLDCFLEIKPREFLKERQSPVAALARHTGKDVYQAFGSPYHINPRKNDRRIVKASEFMGDEGMFPFYGGTGESADACSWFTTCRNCGKYSIADGGARDAVACGCVWYDQPVLPPMHEAITMAAYEAERAFRVVK